MKRLKKTELGKLNVDMSTIRILSGDEQRRVVGGLSAGCTQDGCGPDTRTCSVRYPGCW